jgi:ATP-dependent Clp protease ATP-binding subunit ClpA
MLNKLNKHLRKKHNLEIVIGAELVEVIARKGHNPQFGVRPLARVIQDDIETYVADQLLSDKVPEYLCLFIDPELIEV